MYIHKVFSKFFFLRLSAARRERHTERARYSSETRESFAHPSRGVAALTNQFSLFACSLDDLQQAKKKMWRRKKSHTALGNSRSDRKSWRLFSFSCASILSRFTLVFISAQQSSAVRSAELSLLCFADLPMRLRRKKYTRKLMSFLLAIFSQRYWLRWVLLFCA